LQQQICIYEKIILSAFMLIGLAFSTQAQEISKSNRFTFRRQWRFGTEITYQRALGSNNRLELDLGWRKKRLQK
jgi:hypothetical protein